MDTSDSLPGPESFVAITVKVYLVPLFNSPNVAEVSSVVIEMSSGEEVTVYLVTGLPPSDAGGDHAT